MSYAYIMFYLDHTECLPIHGNNGDVTDLWLTSLFIYIHVKQKVQYQAGNSSSSILEDQKEEAMDCGKTVVQHGKSRGNCRKG